MYVRITESRYGFMQLLGLIECNISMVFAILGYISVETGSLLGAVASMFFMVICLLRAIASYKRGLAYRFMDLFDQSPTWTLDDLDDVEYDEMRETGSTEIEV